MCWAAMVRARSYANPAVELLVPANSLLAEVAHVLKKALEDHWVPPAPELFGLRPGKGDVTEVIGVELGQRRSEFVSHRQDEPFAAITLGDGAA